MIFFFFFQAEDGIRDHCVTGVQTCALPILFGFGVWRDVERFKERTSWPLYRSSQFGISSQLGYLRGINDIAPFRRLEVVPYTIAKNASVANSSAAPGASPWGRKQSMSGGADVKYGVTPNLTLD